MISKNIEEVFKGFKHGAKLVSIQEMISGHINDTYLIITEEKPYYVLQRINHLVFKDVPALVNNKVKVTKHLKSKYDSTTTGVVALSYIPTETNDYYCKDIDGNYWNLMQYIEGSKGFEKATNEKIAYEAGKLFGDFLNTTADFDAADLTETIPNFHDMEFRFSQFDAALIKAPKERLELARNEIEKTKALKDEMLFLNRLKKSGKIPVRVTHSDTKISNALFTQEDKGLCVIDLDTVMPGIIHYDFGDAIRSTCSNADEDEKDLSKVTFNRKFYKSFTRGFLSELKEISKLEAQYLALSAKAMTFIMGLRMLTDFLNEDVYYKTNYKLHNLDRAKNQLKLVAEMDKHFAEMQEVVIEYSK